MQKSKLVSHHLLHILLLTYDPQDVSFLKGGVDVGSVEVAVGFFDAGIRNRYHCLVAGVEKADGNLHAPDVHSPFEEGDILWIVGEKEDVEKVMGN